MTGIKISQLPAIATPETSDAFAVVQDGVTYQETVSQLGNSYLAKSGGTMTGALVLSTSSPSTALDAASKGYVDSVAAGFDFKNTTDAATTADLTTTYSNGAAGVGATLTNAGVQAAFATDGYSASINDRILVKDQITTYENGIYVVTTLGSGATNWVLTRSADYDTAAEIGQGSIVPVTNGTLNANTAWIQTQAITTIGTDAILFNAFSGISALANTHIFVGNASNVATDVALSGDATISNSGALTIANNAVTNAKLAQAPTMTLKGNDTGGTADVTDLTVSDVQTMLGISPGGATAPTLQIFTTGSGTYTTPVGCSYIEVELVGGGGGGATSFAGTVGDNTTFGSLTGNGGGAGIGGFIGGYAAGGTSSGGDINIQGQNSGSSVTFSQATVTAGGGGSSMFGFGGGVPSPSFPVPATGYGGGGSGNSSGSGGGGGGYCYKIFSPPAATYSYAVGAGGAGAGTVEPGTAGIIIVKEYY